MLISVPVIFKHKLCDPCLCYCWSLTWTGMAENPEATAERRGKKNALTWKKNPSLKWTQVTKFQSCFSLFSIELQCTPTLSSEPRRFFDLYSEYIHLTHLLNSPSLYYISCSTWFFFLNDWISVNFALWRNQVFTKRQASIKFTFWQCCSFDDGH